MQGIPSVGHTPGYTPSNFGYENIIAKAGSAVTIGSADVIQRNFRTPLDSPSKLDKRANYSLMAKNRSWIKTAGAGLSGAIIAGGTAAKLASLVAVPLGAKVGAIVTGASGGNAPLGVAVGGSVTTMGILGPACLSGFFSGARVARFCADTGFDVQNIQLINRDEKKGDLTEEAKLNLDRVSCVGRLAVYDQDGVIVDPVYLRNTALIHGIWDTFNGPAAILSSPCPPVSTVFSIPATPITMLRLGAAGADIATGLGYLSTPVSKEDKVLQPGSLGIEQPRVMATETVDIFQSKAYLLMDLCSASHNQFSADEHSQNMTTAVLKTAMGISQESTENSLTEAISKDPVCAYGTLKALAFEIRYSYRSEGAKNMAKELCKKGLLHLRTIKPEFTESINGILTSLNNSEKLEKLEEDKEIKDYARMKDSITKLGDNIRSLLYKGDQVLDRDYELAFITDEQRRFLQEALNSGYSSIVSHIKYTLLEAGALEIEKGIYKLNDRSKTVLDTIEKCGVSNYPISNWWNEVKTQSGREENTLSDLVNRLDLKDECVSDQVSTNSSETKREEFGLEINRESLKHEDIIQKLEDESISQELEAEDFFTEQSINYNKLAIEMKNNSIKYK